MVSLKENINAFLYYLKKIKMDSSSLIITYENILFEMLEVSLYYQENGQYILDITPFRLKNLSNSKKTISKKLSVIDSFIKFIDEERDIAIQLIDNLGINVPKILPKLIDNSIIDKILKECNQEEKLIITLLYGLGLEVSELSLLKLSDISEESILVKSKKLREVPLLPQLYKEIKEYQEIKEPKKFLLETNNELMSIDKIRDFSKKILKRSGVNATSHQLRHSFAIYMLHKGVKISELSELLGYSSIVLTQVYAQLENSKKLNEYMKSHPLGDDKNSKGE